MKKQTVSLGDLICALYDEASNEVGDREAASCLAALSTFDLLLRNEAVREMSGNENQPSPLLLCLGSP